MSKKVILTLLSLAVVLTSSPTPAKDYFEGKTITLVLGAGNQSTGILDRIIGVHGGSL